MKEKRWQPRPLVRLAALLVLLVSASLSLLLQGVSYELHGLRFWQVLSYGGSALSTAILLVSLWRTGHGFDLRYLFKYASWLSKSYGSKAEPGEILLQALDQYVDLVGYHHRELQELEGENDLL